MDEEQRRGEEMKERKDQEHRSDLSTKKEDNEGVGVPSDARTKRARGAWEM